MNRRRVVSGQPQPRSPRVAGAFLGPGGTLPGIPAALSSGPPQPEPPERWTLGPGADHAADVAPDEPDDVPMSIEPVQPTAGRRPRGDETPR